jgi:pyruvate/2-oxoglutarate dehydrogenase complex dihydrolipoamide dehydrogenase (E3) component
MSFDFELIIIGAGSAGRAAAELAPRMGVRAALVERGRVGGDCLWAGCVPSKALIASARVAHRIRHADDVGLPPASAAIDTGAVLARVRAVRARVAAESDNEERLASLGVRVLHGEAAVRDAHTVDVDGRLYTTRFILLATGSRPAVPPIEGLCAAGFLTSATLFELESLPASLLVVGGGPAAVELAQAVARLGTRVTLLEALPRILAREEPGLSGRVHDMLERDGVSVEVGAELRCARAGGGSKVLAGRVGGTERVWTADEILIATGRTPNIERLGLEGAGVVYTARGVSVDKHLRTSVRSIYAAGDVAGRYLFTHNAVSEAATALRNMFYPGSKAAPSVVPWTVFTDPELGHAGLTSAEARLERGERGVLVFRQALADSDRARSDAGDGEFILVTDTRYRLLGAHVLAPCAGELMGLLADAVARRARLTPDFANMVQVYPTFAFSLSQAAGEATYRQLGRPFLRAMRRLCDVMS